jgi:hypothetical protein
MEHSTAHAIGAGASLLEGSYELGTAADPTLVDQLSSALKSAVATTAELSNVSVDQGADSLLSLMQSRRAAGVSDGSKQSIIDATSSLLRGTDECLASWHAGCAESAAQGAAAFAKLTPLLRTLADKMRDTAVVGEVATASGATAAVATSSAGPALLAGPFGAAPFSSGAGAATGGITVPAGLGDALGMAHVNALAVGLVDVSLIASTVNTHPQAAETAGTQLLEVTFAAPGANASSLQALGAGAPLALAVPITAAAWVVGGPSGGRCYAVLCYAMLRYAMLCYAMLCQPNPAPRRQLRLRRRMQRAGGHVRRWRRCVHVRRAVPQLHRRLRVR